MSMMNHHEWPAYWSNWNRLQFFDKFVAILIFAIALFGIIGGIKSLILGEFTGLGRGITYTVHGTGARFIGVGQISLGLIFFCAWFKEKTITNLLLPLWIICVISIIGMVVAGKN